MAVGATAVVVGAARLLIAADLDYAVADCAFAAIIASVIVTAADFPAMISGLEFTPENGGEAGIRFRDRKG